MEKLTGPKHNHLFTDLIKVAIFGLMLLLPFLCFLPTGFYYGFNEHATNTETTTINYKYESNEVNTYDDLVEGNIYHFNYNGYGDEIGSPAFFEVDLRLLKVYQYNFSNCDLDLDETNWSSILENTDISVTFAYTGGLDLTFVVALNDDENLFTYFGTIDSEFLLNAIVKIDKIYYTNRGDKPCNMYEYTDYNVIESVSVNTDDTISNKMYQAWQGVWTSPLFNWTNNTPLNTGLNGFVSIFGINQSSYIANCLIYLLSIAAIYVVFDIVLGIFKWLTHLINK